MNKNTTIIEHTILFASTKPISAPSFSVIQHNASKPDIVVKLEPAISGIALDKASVKASFGSNPFPFSSANLCDNIIA